MSSAKADIPVFSQLTQGSSQFDKDQFTSDIIVIQNNGNHSNFNTGAPHPSSAANERPGLPSSSQIQPITASVVRHSLNLLADQDVSQSVEVLDASEIIEDEMAALSGGRIVSDCDRSTSHEEVSSKGGLSEKTALSNSTPDVEEPSSQDFMTADFFIDESMPSSMTESPSNRRLLELQQSLQDKTSQVESLTRELDLCRTLLDKETKKCESLCEATKTRTSDIRTDISQLVKEFNSERDNLVDYIKCVKHTCLNVITKYLENQEATHEKVLTEVNDKQASVVKELENKLDIESQKLSDAYEEVNVYQQKVLETEKHYESLKEEMDLKVSELERNIEVEKTEISKRLMLEHEIELDKVRSDFIHDIETKDAEIQSLQDNLHEKTTLSTKLQSEKDSLVETLTAELEIQKEKEIEVLNKNHSEKLEEELNSLKDSLIKSHQMELSELKADFNEKLKAALSEQEAELTVVNEQIVEKLKETLNQSHEEEIEDVKRSCFTEIESKVKSLRDTLTQEYEEKLQQIKTEFELEKEKLITEQTDRLNDAKNELTFEHLKMEKQSSLDEVSIGKL